MADDPPYLTVGTEVSAKYKGAFCEAKIRKVVRVVKCKVTFKAGNGGALLTDDHIKGTLRIGANVEAKHPDKNQFLEATINKIQDCSQYTVVFDDGDITTLRRSALCLKSGRHFNESETLDQLPLTHPEHFSNPVVGGRRGVRRRVLNTDAEKEDSSEEEDEDIPAKKDGRRKYDKELDMGKVVCVESTDKKKSKDTWFPALVVSPGAQETVKIRIKDEYLVRSFRDGRYYTVPKKEITEFTRESSTKYETNSNVLRTAVDKALQYLEKHELPPHWDREVLFGSVRQTESVRDDEQSDSDVSEDDPREEKDRFIAQLYKFMDDRSTPLNKVPQVCSKDLDLHKLFKVVTSKGGYTKVTNQSQWKAITIKMGFGNMPSTSTINLVKQAYKKFLFNFEEFYRKLGCTWTPRSVPTSSKSRSSRSIFRERITPSSSRESVRESREREKKEEAAEESSSSTSKKDAKEKEKEKEKEEKEKDKDKSTSSIEAESPEPVAVVSEPEAKKPEQEEPRRSRGRQKKEKEVEVEEPTSSPSAATKKKRQLNASKERDSSVASSKEDGGPPTPSSSTASTPTTTKKIGVGRGKYKRNSTKTSATSETEEKEVKEEKPVVPPPAEPSIPKSIAVRLGDKLSVYYPKSEGKTYEAKVIDINDKNESFLVHYTGWNNRYDEWIDRSRVSQNITLKIESGDTDGGKNGGKGTGKRKGRNSSSATSTTSSNAAAPTPPPATPTSSTSSGTRSKSATGKRKRSTSSEIQVMMSTTPKRRRTRQKSGQDSSTAAQASESEPETSDSDVKSIKSEKNTGGPPGSRIGGRDMVTPTPESDAVSTKEQKSTVSTKGDVKKDKKEKRLVDDDEGMSSSSESTKSKDVKEVPPVQIISTSKVEDTKESSSSSTSCSQVIDLNQIRSEMKGLNKMVKSAPGTATATPASSPVPPSLAAVGSSPSEATKVDIYEFQEDANDDTATSAAPKLKMFSPRSPDKGPTAAPEVSPKKDETPATDPIPEKAEKVVKVEVGAGDIGKPAIAASTAAPAETPKDTTAKVSVEKAVPPAQPKTIIFSSGGTPTTLPASMSPYVALNSSSVPASLLTSVASSSSTSVASVLVTTTPSVMSATVAPSLVAVASTALTPVSKTKPILGMAQRVSTPLTSNVPLRTTPASVVSILPVTSGSSPASHPPPPPLVPSGTSTISLVTSASSAPISAAVVIPAHSVNLGSPPPPVLIQRPPIQPVLTPLRPLLTISSSAPAPTGTVLERPLLQPVVTGHTVPLMSTSTVSSAAKDAAKLLPFVTSTTRRQDMFPHLVHSAPDVTSGSRIPTISIISAKEATGSEQPPIQTQVQQLQHPFPPVAAPIKVAATIPPPPPVLKPVVKSTTSYGPIGIETTPAVKQKKKKSRTLSSSPASSSATTITPVKSMAPLPSGGAPPPPPVVVSTVSSGMTSMPTPTPGRKTPVKKRIPPPLESPGKPMKTLGTPLKPGKMNPEAMNAAIANVGASPPVVVSVSTAPVPVTAVPTTVITSTANLFQTASFNSPGVLFATTTTSQQPQLAQKITPPPPPPVTIKSSAESIAASIAAVASMGSASKSPLISVKSGMPTKRFMKDSPSKDKLFPGSVSVMPQQMQLQQAPPHLQMPGGPPQSFMIGKAMDSCQQQQHQTQAPITIQAKFQTGGPHTISATPISGPAVTFVKTTGHHLLEQGHVQSNLPKHPVIIIPAAPVVIKPAPFQHHPTPQPIHQQQHHPQHHHHPHTTMQPVIVSKSLQMDAISLSQPSVLMTAAPSSSVVKSGTMLPITVTPSIMHSTPIVSVTMHQQGMSTPVIDVKPSMVDLPPTITVTKATTVMKSISPDIVAVSSYNSSSKSASSMGFSQFKQDLNVPAVQLTKLEPEPRKEPEIVLKPAPPSAQIVFQTESKRGDIVQVSQASSSTKLGSEQGALRGAATTTAPSSADESCNSLLCEEIIPGSPTTGEESEKIEEEMGSDSKKVDKSEDEEDAMSEPRLPTQGSSSKPVIVLGPKYDDDEDDFMLDLMNHRRSRFVDGDDDKLDDRSVDSPMGPPSEGRMDLPFRDSFSDGDGGDHDHSPPSSPSTTSSISTDDSSRHRDTSRLSPTPGGSSKSKDSDDDDMDSDVGSKSTHIDDGDSKHGSTRGSRRIRNQSSRLGRSPSPPMSKRRRTMRRNKSPEEEMSRYTQRSRTSSGRKITPVGGMSESKEVKVTPPVPPVNLAKPPKTGRYNFIPNLNGITDPDQRISMISQAIYDLKDQYHKTKTEAASFDRRVKRWKRRVREKERLARQEATRAAS